MTWKLDGRVAVVTGGASGIGLATAKTLHASGATIVIADREGKRTEDALAQLGGDSDSAVAIPANVAEEESVRRLFAVVIERFGRVDVLVNNAGVGGDAGAVHASSTDNWDIVMDVNIRGQFLCAKYALPSMLTHEAGVLVNVASAFGAVGVRRFPAYVASKGAVIALTRQMAVDYGSSGIRVNAVLPGYIDNDMGRSRDFLTPLEAEAALHSRLRAAALQPLQRQGSVAEVASAIAFLASDASSFVSGVALPVDGGMLASLNDGGGL